MNDIVIVMLIVPIAMCSPVIRQADEETSNNISATKVTLVSREVWGGRAPRQRDPLNTPVPNVILHHTYVPGACTTPTECEGAMRSMQSYHMDTQGWNDIGYNFCVGGDGKVYEGRGWSTLGAHASGSNSVSIGVCIIGDWTAELPPQEQLDVTKALIKLGVSLGYVRPEYSLLGHRQVRDTECPGNVLFKEISTWNHFSMYLKSPRKSFVEVKLLRS